MSEYKPNVHTPTTLSRQKQTRKQTKTCHKPFYEQTTFEVTRSHASAAKQRRTALFWVITQRVVVIYYRRFGTTYRVSSAGV
jgi:hypothetical protein